MRHALYVCHIEKANCCAKNILQRGKGSCTDTLVIFINFWLFRLRLQILEWIIVFTLFFIAPPIFPIVTLLWFLDVRLKIFHLANYEGFFNNGMADTVSAEPVLSVLVNKHLYRGGGTWCVIVLKCYIEKSLPRQLPTPDA